jgi:hypothetical protein
MGQHLNHYVVIDGPVAEDALRVIHQWLGERNARQLTERVYVYSVGIETEESMRESRELLQRLRGMSPGSEWEPFRVLFLWPKGNGSFSYKMPSVSASGDGAIGTGGWTS